MTLQIVPVNADNAAEAGFVHAEAWQASHRGFCTPAFIALHTAQRQTRRLLEKRDSGSRIFLMRLKREAVGVVSVAGSLIEDLYILPRFQNRGLGTALLRFAIKQCEGRPKLWILENNAGAERLYRREGFIPTGRRNAITGKLDEVEFELPGGV